MRGLIEHMDQFSVTERNELRDERGRVIGITTARANGDIVLRDVTNAYVGAYTSRTNETRDKRGHLVGKGNLLAMLLKEGFGSDASSGRGGSRTGGEGGANDARDAELTHGVAQRDFAVARGGSEEPGRNPNPRARANAGPRNVGRGMGT